MWPVGNTAKTALSENGKILDISPLDGKGFPKLVSERWVWS